VNGSNLKDQKMDLSLFTFWYPKIVSNHVHTAEMAPSKVGSTPQGARAHFRSLVASSNPQAGRSIFCCSSSKLYILSSVYLSLGYFLKTDTDMELCCRWLSKAGSTPQGARQFFRSLVAFKPTGPECIDRSNWHITTKQFSNFLSSISRGPTVSMEPAALSVNVVLTQRSKDIFSHACSHFGIYNLSNHRSHCSRYVTKNDTMGSSK
jgi:hypothetical protein